MPEPLMDVDGAAEALGVDADRVRVMAEEGLLTPVAGEDDLRFDATEVHALHNLGG